MLSKLLKNDLKKNMSWMWILFVSTVAIALLSRGCKELAENITFFKILAIFFDSIFYALIVNTLLHPFLRGFLNFSKSLYGDESYLTHTLPVTKNQIINSKYLTSLIETLLGFITVVISLLIVFGSPTMFDTLKILLSLTISGDFSIVLLLTLIVLLILVEFLMFLSIIFFSIILAYKSKEKRVLKTFLFTTAFAFASSTVLSIALVIVLLINNVSLTSATLTLSANALFSIILTGIIIYLAITTLFYFLAKKEFNKGVNVD